MRCRMALFWSRKIVVTVTAAWILASFGWLTWRSDGLGGRPLVVLLSDDPGNYDPHATSDSAAQAIFQRVCEPLFYLDFDGSLHGLLAEDQIVHTDGGRNLAIRVRQGITFHDGTPLNAAAVQASFERLQHRGVSPL